MPAGPELYDVYDELLMHYRRYTARGLRSLIEESGLAVVRFTHLGALLYPAFYVVKRRNRRLLSREEALKRDVVAREIRTTRGVRYSASSSKLSSDWPTSQLAFRYPLCCCRAKASLMAAAST